MTLLIGAAWRHLRAVAYNLSNSSYEVGFCRHQWGRHKGSKLMGCGITGCAFDVHSEEGVRGVKKVYYGNSSASSKHNIYRVNPSARADGVSFES